METSTLHSGELLPIDFPSIEGISDVNYGEVEVVSVADGMVLQSYPVAFFETE